MCAENPVEGGLQIVEIEEFTCPPVAMPMCGPCYQLESYVVDCCTNYRCVPQELCCENNIGKMVIILYLRHSLIKLS